MSEFISFFSLLFFSYYHTYS